MASDTQNGIFWSPDGGRNGVGTLRFEGERGRSVIQCGIIVRPYGLVGEGAEHYYEPSALNIAHNRVQRTIWGELETGERITLCDAAMTFDMSGVSPCPTETFDGYRLVRGVHLTKNDPVTCIRWAFDFRSSFSGSDEDCVSCNLGHLRWWEGRVGVGFELNLVDARPFRDVVEHIPIYSAALYTLMTGKKVELVTVEFTLADGRDAIFELPEVSGAAVNHPLLEPRMVDLHRMATWLDFREKLGRYPFLWESLSGPIEIQGQVAATALEGLGRILATPGALFGDLERADLKKLRREAKCAGIAVLRDMAFSRIEDAERAFDSALARIGEPGYRDLVSELLEPVARLIPPLFGGDLGRWVGDARSLRNDESHGGEPSILNFDQTSRYLAVVRTAAWSLRLRLLLQVFTASELRDSLAKSSELRFVFANLDVDGVLPGYSYTEEFLKLLKVGPGDDTAAL